MRPTELQEGQKLHLTWPWNRNVIIFHVDYTNLRMELLGKSAEEETSVIDFNDSPCLADIIYQKFIAGGAVAHPVTTKWDI